jgi:hypothetical protein
MPEPMSAAGGHRAALDYWHAQEDAALPGLPAVSAAETRLPSGWWILPIFAAAAVFWIGLLVTLLA